MEKKDGVWNKLWLKIDWKNTIAMEEKNLERIGVHDGMGDRSPNQLLAELTAH